MFILRLDLQRSRMVQVPIHLLDAEALIPYLSAPHSDRQTVHQNQIPDDDVLFRPTDITSRRLAREF